MYLWAGRKNRSLYVLFLRGGIKYTWFLYAANITGFLRIRIIKILFPISLDVSYCKFRVIKKS